METDHKTPCPKCAYRRTATDDEFVPKTECPKCGIVYQKFIKPQEQPKWKSHGSPEEQIRDSDKSKHRAGKKNKTAVKALQFSLVSGGMVVLILFILLIIIDIPSRSNIHRNSPLPSSRAEKRIDERHKPSRSILESREKVKSSLNGLEHGLHHVSEYNDNGMISSDRSPPVNSQSATPNQLSDGVDRYTVDNNKYIDQECAEYIAKCNYLRSVSQWISPKIMGDVCLKASMCQFESYKHSSERLASNHEEETDKVVRFIDDIGRLRENGHLSPPIRYELWGALRSESIIAHIPVMLSLVNINLRGGGSWIPPNTTFHVEDSKTVEVQGAKYFLFKLHPMGWTDSYWTDAVSLYRAYFPL